MIKHNNINTVIPFVFHYENVFLSNHIRQINHTPDCLIRLELWLTPQVPAVTAKHVTVKCKDLWLVLYFI